MSTPPSVDRPPVWWVRSLRRDPHGGPGTVVVHGVATADRPDGTVVDVGGLPAGAAVAAGRTCRVGVDAGTHRLLTAELLGDRAAGAPRLVLVERMLRPAGPALGSPAGVPADGVTAELAAFAHDLVAARATARGGYVAAGAVVAPADAARLGLRPAERAGALRWCPSTGRVLALDVAPARRRRGVEEVLLLVAAGAAVARGLPRPWVDGTRPGPGEAVRRRLRLGAAVRAGAARAGAS